MLPKCPHCGATVLSEDTACAKCGQPLREAVQVDSPPAASLADRQQTSTPAGEPTSPPTPQHALIPCPECGNSVSARAVACPRCGYPLQDVPSAQPRSPSPAASSAPIPEAGPLWDRAASPQPAEHRRAGTTYCGKCGKYVYSLGGICPECFTEMPEHSAARRRRGWKMYAMSAGCALMVATAAVAVWFYLNQAQRDAAALKAVEAAALQFVARLNKGQVTSLEEIAGPSFFQDLGTSCNVMVKCRNIWPLVYQSCALSASTGALDSRCAESEVRAEFVRMVTTVRTAFGDCKLASLSHSDQVYANLGGSTDARFFVAYVGCGEVGDRYVFDHFYLRFDPQRNAWLLDGMPDDWMLKIRSKLYTEPAEQKKPRTKRR